MELAGICMLCNKGSRTLNTCWRCGARVCNACFDFKSGLCIKCSPKGGTWK